MTNDGTDTGGNAPARVKRDEVRRGTNRGVVMVCLGALLTMGAATWAAVPLYRLFCQVTGYGGTPMRADQAPDVVLDQVITVRFDATVAPGLKWRFAPVQRTVDVKIGETMLAFYKAENLSDKPIKGTATFNVSPDSAGAYFSKMECFCFTEQTLDVGESVDMPVSFFIDPSILEDRDARRIKEITLSYTFYPMEGANNGKAAEAKPQADSQRGG